MTTLASLYHTDYKHFTRKVRFYTKNQDVAEDIVQEAFVKALNKLDQFNPKKGSLKGWFTKVLFSCLWDHMRVVKKLPHMSDIDLLDEKDLPLVVEGTDWEELIVVENPVHRRVLFGYYALGYTYKEIAEMFGVTQDNARKVVQRFKEGVK